MMDRGPWFNLRGGCSSLLTTASAPSRCGRRCVPGGTARGTNGSVKLAAPLLALILLALPAATQAAAPIPQNQAELAGLDAFSGKAAKRHRVAAPRVPRHPFMAANGRNAVHNDAYQTDTYTNAGPLGRRPSVFSQSIDGRAGSGPAA
jgi:hypothetical protein